MKVGVITFHSANNYGAVLQAWALQKVLKNYGLDTGIIHYHPDIIDGLYDPMRLKRGMKRRLKKMTLSVRNKKSLIRYNKFQAFEKKHFNLIGDFRTYDELKAAGLDLDAYITGSDQVWNPGHIGGFDPAYFLDFAETGKKKLSYAPSVGSDYIEAGYQEDIRRSLSTFTGISVRESSVKKAISRLTDKKVEVVLDPTLLLKREDYEEIKVKSTIREPYILVYSIERNSQVMELANKLSVSLGLPVIQRRPLPGLINELEPFYTADAGEFLGLIEGAQVVITNSFHGTVFSVLYERPFISMLHSDTGSRTEDLLTELGLKSHILNSISEFTDFSMCKIDDPKRLSNRIEELKRTSVAFLVRNLGLSDRYKKVKCPTNITKEKCYGCQACRYVCPVKAIKMKEDKEGFIYPVYDKDKCTGCDLCYKICIRRNPRTVNYKEQYPKAYCACNTDREQSRDSSSGGIYPALAGYAINDMQGVAVGVKFDENMKAVADIAGDMEAAVAFSGSKYVKSSFSGIFPKVKKLLKEGRFVLYSGLPCECAGLRAYLRKDYPNLLICELICHAAPSPKVFKKYIESINIKYGSDVRNIVFRDKKDGWRAADSNMVITTKDGRTHKERLRDNLYYRAFIDHITIRPSCSNCKYTYGKRAGDITIGDCWGADTVAPELENDRGVSLVLVNNEKGDSVWEEIKGQFRIKESDLKSVFLKNHKKSAEDNALRTVFFNQLDQEPIEELLKKYTAE